MLKNKNIQNRLIKAFIIQLFLISAVAACGVFATKYLMSDVLMHQALKGEAKHYWALKKQRPDLQLPNTDNLTAYAAYGRDDSKVPKAFRALPEGLSTLVHDDKKSIVYVESHQGVRLFLDFDYESVSQLTLLFGTVPLTFVLVVLYLLAWFAYRQASSAISPLIRLAEQVDKMKVSDDASLALKLDEFWGDSDVEVSILANALEEFTQRIQLYIDRERLFTRDVSHELRTPIAVIKGSLELIERKYNAQETPAVQRMQRTLHDMESLIETLLLLGRGELDQLPSQAVEVNRIVHQQVESLSLLFHDKPIELNVVDEAIIKYRLPEQVLGILISNLLRNACNYTPKGEVVVTVHKNGISIEDTGVGIEQSDMDRVFAPYYRTEQLKNAKGHGLGLTIVKRLCNRYDLKLRVTSEVGKGTQVFLSLPKSRVMPQ